MGNKLSCIRRSHSAEEVKRGHSMSNVSHKDGSGVNAGRNVNVGRDVNNYFQPADTSVEKQKDYTGERVAVRNEGVTGVNAATVKIETYNYNSPSATAVEKQKNYTDALLNIKQKLKSNYVNLQMPKMPWYKRSFLSLEEYFVNLQLCVHHSNAIGSYHSIELSEIFEPIAGTEPFRILVEASPGYGKSTLSLKIASDWERNASYVSKFDLVFLLQLRRLMAPVDEAILEAGKVCNTSLDTVRAVIEQNSEKVLLILDGFDELPNDKLQWILPLLESKLYPRMTVILTSRSGYSPMTNTTSNASMQNEFVNIYWRKQIRIAGIPLSEQIPFLKKCFSDCSDEVQGNWDKMKTLIPDIPQDFFECPLFLLLIYLIADEEDVVTVPKTKTDLYKAIFNFVIKRSFYKDGTVHNADIFHIENKNVTFLLELLKKFGKLSLSALQKRKLFFTEEEIINACGGDTRILKLGFITKNSSIQVFYGKEYYEPIHKTFLEFLAAVHLWLLYENGFKDEFILELQAVHSRIDYGLLLLPFLCGLLKDNAFSVFHALQSHIMLYHDLGLFDRSLIECELTEELLAALLKFIPSHWKIGYGWPLGSAVHSSILSYGIQIGRITSIEWNLGSNIVLLQSFEIPRMFLVVNDYTNKLNRLNSDTIICKELILNFGSASLVPADAWRYMLSLISTQIKASNVVFDMRNHTHTLLPLLCNEVRSGNLKATSVTGLICVIKESKTTEELLLAINELIEIGSLQKLCLTLSLEDMTNNTQILNQLILQASQSVSLQEFEIISNCPLEINLLNAQSAKQWKRLKFSNCKIFLATDVSKSSQLTEVDTLELDSTPTDSLTISAMKFFRVKVLICEDTTFNQLIQQHTENVLGYKHIHELVLKVTNVDSGKCFAHLNKLKSLERIALVILSKDDEALVESVHLIIRAFQSLKVNYLSLNNVRNDFKFVNRFLRDLFEVTEALPRDCLDACKTETINTNVLRELTIGIGATPKEIVWEIPILRPMIDIPALSSMLNELRKLLASCRLQKLNIAVEAYDPITQLPMLLDEFFPSEQFKIDFVLDETKLCYSICCSESTLLNSMYPTVY